MMTYSDRVELVANVVDTDSGLCVRHALKVARERVQIVVRQTRVQLHIDSKHGASAEHTYTERELFHRNIQHGLQHVVCQRDKRGERHERILAAGRRKHREREPRRAVQEHDRTHAVPEVCCPVCFLCLRDIKVGSQGELQVGRVERPHHHRVRPALHRAHSKKQSRTTHKVVPHRRVQLLNEGVWRVVRQLVEVPVAGQQRVVQIGTHAIDGLPVRIQLADVTCNSTQ